MKFEKLNQSLFENFKQKKVANASIIRGGKSVVTDGSTADFSTNRLDNNSNGGEPVPD